MQSEGAPPARTRRHVVLVGPTYPFRGGIAQFTDSMARGLEGRGHSVSSVTFSRLYPSLLFPGKTQYEPDRSRTARAPALIDSINPLTWRSAAAKILAMKPDVVIFQYWLPFFAPAYATMARLLKRRAPGVRLLAVAHNVMPHEGRPGDAALGRFFLRRCDAIAALSESVADDARTLEVEADVRVLAHPIYEHFGSQLPRDEARRLLGLPDDGEIMLFFGFIRKYKGLHVLLRALPQIVRNRPSARLVVAGEFYDDEASYRAIIKTTGMEDRVHVFSEYIPEADVRTYFSAADVIVQPYVSATQSGVVPTAFHFERPVVVADVGGLAEIVPHGEAGLVVPPGDPDALAVAVTSFFADDMAERLANGVRREKAKYGWDSFCAAVEDLFG